MSFIARDQISVGAFIYDAYKVLVFLSKLVCFCDLQLTLMRSSYIESHLPIFSFIPQPQCLSDMGNFVGSLERPGPVVGFLYRNEMGLLYWGLCLFKMMVHICDFFLDRLFGYTITMGTREEREMAKDYEHSAQIASIMGRGSYTIVMNHQLHHYCLKHEQYVHPRYILENDNITLQGMTPTHAFFCVSEPDVNVYDTSVFPFLWVKQYLTAKKLVVIPHSTLHRLAAEVGDPTDRKLTLLNITCRCGSTLICQMINTVPRVRTMSEPWSFNHLHNHYVGGRIGYGDLRQLVQSAIRLQCKKENNTEIEHILIKMNAFASPIFPMLIEMYPNAKYIFNTRIPMGTMASYAQIVNHIPIIAKLVELLTGSVCIKSYHFTLSFKGLFFQIFSEWATFPYDDPKGWELFYERKTKYRQIHGKSISTFIHEGLLLCYGGQVRDCVKGNVN